MLCVISVNKYSRVISQWAYLKWPSKAKPFEINYLESKKNKHHHVQHGKTSCTTLYVSDTFVVGLRVSITQQYCPVSLDCGRASSLAPPSASSFKKVHAGSVHPSRFLSTDLQGHFCLPTFCLVLSQQSIETSLALSVSNYGQWNALPLCWLFWRSRQLKEILKL